MNDFAMYHSGSPILYYARECRGLWVCTDELHFNDLVADREVEGAIVGPIDGEATNQRGKPVVEKGDVGI